MSDLAIVPITFPNLTLPPIIRPFNVRTCILIQTPNTFDNL